MKQGWPATRECPQWIAEDSAIRRAWNRSRKLVDALRAELENAELSERVDTIYSAGSLGRMEVVDASDCDLVVVLPESLRASTDANTIMESVFDCVSRTGFQRPKSGGVFGTATSFEQLLDESTRGQVDEPLPVFGKRIQSLLDSQPILNPDRFSELQLGILNRYSCAPRVASNEFPLGGLVDDLIRYWRSLCMRSRWLHHDQPVKWRLINVKLRFSRLLLFAGLMHILLSTSSSDCAESVVVKLTRTPLERVPTPELTSPAYEQFMLAMERGLKSEVADQVAFEELIAGGQAFANLLANHLPSGSAAAWGLFSEFPA